MALFGGYLQAKKKALWSYLLSWQAAVYSMVVLAATMVVIFWASVFLYTSFYFTFMPQESIKWPIHFSYKSCQEGPGLCSNPVAKVMVTDPGRGSVLMRGQQYRVVVDLEMPESPTNQHLGMFLIMMEMADQHGNVIQEASRSAMLRYKSPLLHTLSTTIFAPFLLYGMVEEKQIITVELFSQYEEDPIDPLWDVFVEVKTRHVEFYSATLRIHATFTGLRYFMYYYPLTAALIGIGICMVFLAAVVILSWYQFSGPTLFIQAPIRTTATTKHRRTSITPAQPPKTSDSKDKKADSSEKSETQNKIFAKKEEENENTGKRKDSGTKEKMVSPIDEVKETEKAVGDDFEVLNGSRTHDMKSGDEMKLGEEEEGESVLRHRIQHLPE